MQALMFHQVGEPAEVLQLETLPSPTPASGELLIKVQAANINPSDLLFVRGLYGIRPQPPAAGGFEASGIVEQAGPDTNLPAGTQVSFVGQGVWQEYVCVPEREVIPLPAELNLSPEVACQAFVNPLTAFGLLALSGLKKGDSVLLTAGASALGKMLIGLCKERGIKTYVT
ncbi:MAG: alcohol dehydrogenase catalytic domain-containing protein, partial [Bacteroidota bacterium]